MKRQFYLFRNAGLNENKECIIVGSHQIWTSYDCVRLWLLYKTFSQTHCTCIVAFFSTCTYETGRTELELRTKTCGLQLSLAVLPPKHRNTCLLFYVLILATRSICILTPSSYCAPDKSCECKLTFWNALDWLRTKQFLDTIHKITPLCICKVSI